MHIFMGNLFGKILSFYVWGKPIKCILCAAGILWKDHYSKFLNSKIIENVFHNPSKSYFNILNE